MLWYLDGRVNRRASPAERPNENYARELLELHTLGVHAGYTQDDVMHAARALTGWTVRSRHESTFGIGRVEFDRAAHDDGEKVVLGERIPAGGGARDVDILLNIVTAHPACARFIAGKLCRHFIADDPPAAAIDAVARTFAATGGDIVPTLRTLFGTPEFVAARGTRLKRPFHFVASALRATGADTDGGRAMIGWLERLGELPFQFPTPDGYPDEAGPWLGTLLWRWQFAAGARRGAHRGDDDRRGRARATRRWRARTSRAPARPRANRRGAATPRAIRATRWRSRWRLPPSSSPDPEVTRDHILEHRRA